MNKTLNKKYDILEGNILKALIHFAIPILLINILNQFYTLADSKIIGVFIGLDAYAAVGASVALINLFDGITINLSYGFSIFLSTKFGAKNMADVKRVSSASHVLMAICSVVMLVIELTFTKAFLTFLGTPAEIFDGAYRYCIIIFCGTPFVAFFNLYANNLRAIGDSKSSLYILLATTILNIVLDIIFITVFNLGIDGAALATVVSQGLSVIFVFLRQRKFASALTFTFKNLRSSLEFAPKLLKLGISVASLSILVHLGTISLQYAINNLGYNTIVAHTSGRRLDVIFMIPLQTISSAVAVFVAQNYGTGNFDRIKKGIATSIKIGFAWNVISSIIGIFVGRGLVVWLTGVDTPEIIDQGYLYLLVNVCSMFVLNLLFIFKQVLIGFNQSLITIITGVIEFSVKVTLVFALTSVFGYLAVIVAEPLSWVAMAIVEIIYYKKYVKSKTFQANLLKNS
ncbi:MAG: MATE family efflux transporter [Clostridia bacterium]